MQYFTNNGEEAVRSLDNDMLRLYCMNIIGEWVGSEWISWLKKLYG